MHSMNEMYDYIFNKKTPCTFVGDHKILVKFVSKYPVLLRVEGVHHLCACLYVL